MDPRRFARLKDLVAEALELPAADRLAFVQTRCPGDPELLGEVVSLLEQESAADSGVTAAVEARVERAAAGIDGDGDGEAHPDSVGPYRILAVLGQGGMGTVYRAEQREPLHREVALKVIRRGGGGPSALARFASESQALAAMDHPHIARVFDAGSTEDGRPYFAMELVDGRPITGYCDEERLGIRQRLDLFAQVCHAVQHAHQRGIIHRDLKPSNVLVTEVDGRPIPKIIDFGIAKLTEEHLGAATLLTEAGVLMGTLEYMSPEQAALAASRVDTRADIYSLGVLLYELASGRLPFDPQTLRSAAVLEAQRMLLHQDPPRPSLRLDGEDPAAVSTVAAARATDPRSLRRRLRGDLDWVVMKALEKDPDRRYQSAHGLAREIERILHHEPVTAGPPSARYRAAKFVRRHRVGVLAAAAVAVALIVGSGLAVTGMLRATRAQQRAEAEAATTGAINDFLTDMLVSVQPDKARGDEVTVREILAAAAEKMNEDERFAGSPEVQASLSFTIGETHMLLGDYDVALQFLEHSLAVRRRLFDETDERVIDTLDAIGRVHWETGDLEASLQVARELLALRERTVGRLHVEYSAALGNVGNIYADMGRADEAEACLREALAIDREILSDEQGADLAVSLNNLGTLLSDQGNYAEAIELHRESLALRRRIHGEPSPAVVTALNNLGFAQLGLDDLAAAESTLGEAMEDTEQIFGDAHPQTALAWNNLAGVLRRRGRHEEAEPLLRRALATFTETIGPRSWRTGSVHASLGSLLTATGRLEEAEAELLLAWDILSGSLDAGSKHVRGAADSLAALYAARGDASLAAAWEERAARDAR